MRKMSEYIGDLISVNKFLEWVKTGCIIDYDGSGTMFDINEKNIGGIHPSDILFPDYVKKGKEDKTESEKFLEQYGIYNDAEPTITPEQLKEKCAFVVWCNR